MYNTLKLIFNTIIFCYFATYNGNVLVSSNPKMKRILTTLTLIILVTISCNTTFFNQKDYLFKLADFEWNKIIKDQVGEIYLKESNFIFGRNWDSTFIVISPDNGAFIDTLKRYRIEKERESLILDNSREFKSGYSLYNVPVDKHKYSKVTLKVFDRQYRGDEETFYLIINTLSDSEFTILFNRGEFRFISDITYFKDGQFIMTYNGESATDDQKYFNCIGLFDLDEIMNK